LLRDIRRRAEGICHDVGCHRGRISKRKVVRLVSLVSPWIYGREVGAGEKGCKDEKQRDVKDEHGVASKVYGLREERAVSCGDARVFVGVTVGERLIPQTDGFFVAVPSPPTFVDGLVFGVFEAEGPEVY
jgi:hypothetical protein